MNTLRIKEIMVEKKTTNKSLGLALGLTPQTISNISVGRTKPNLQTLEKISLELGVELRELFLEIIKRNIPVQPQRIGTITP